MRVLASFLTLLAVAQAFVPQSNHRPASSTTVDMAPRFDKKTQLWYPTSPEEGPEAGYPVINTLLLHGPKAFFVRVGQPDNYEQAVLKFMAQDSVDRQEAMGNMDAYFVSAWWFS